MKCVNSSTITPQILMDESTEKLAHSHFIDQQQNVFKRTDRIFIGLMLFQWLASIVVAFRISPRTWSGPVSTVHPHIWMAVFLGGAITLLPVFLALKYSGQSLTRHVIAVGQMLMSSMLIHISGGRIETHFHIFGSLAFIALYRDWRVLISATIVAAADHILRGAYAPQSIYGVITVNNWRWVEHASWVIFEDVILFLACAQSNEEMQRISERQAQLEASIEIINSVENELRESKILKNAMEGIAQLDSDGNYLSANLAYATIFGYSHEELIRLSWKAMICAQDHRMMQESFDYAKLKLKSETETQAIRKDGSLFHAQMTLVAAQDDAGNFAAYHCFMKDISARKALEERISHQAFHDALTGLPNRILFTDRAEHAFARSKREMSYIAVMFLDIDNFKYVNDSLGHDEGDRLLVNFANRIQDCVRPGDTVARMGGDEFTILLENITEETDAIKVADRILESLSHPIRLEKREITISSSIGVALSIQSIDGTESLLRDADTAMYHAKTTGKACYIKFDGSMNDRATERLELESGLRNALESGELRLLYQPILHLETGEIIGGEALIRWQHPTLGLVSPAKFIPLAEETGLIVPIGAWVLREACIQAKSWQDEFGESRNFVMSVNLSGRQFQSQNLLGLVRDTLQETGLKPSGLKLEITESAMIDDVEAAIDKMNALKDLGVLLAVDDFGTGYSSLAYLRRLPVNTVKIDQSFINIMGCEPQPAAIVQTIIMLCRALNLDVTGEGIENKDQLLQLQGMGCDLGQGYFFSKPVDSSTFNKLLKTRYIKKEYDVETKLELKELLRAA